MTAPDAPGHESLEQAREIVWDAVQMLEEAQRVLFRAGDRYVAEVWGDGVRAVLDRTEDLAEIVGDLTAAHIELGKLAKRDRARDD